MDCHSVQLHELKYSHPPDALIYNQVVMVLLKFHSSWRYVGMCEEILSKRIIQPDAA